MKRKVFSLMMLCLFAFLGLANAQVTPRDGGLTVTPDPLEMGYRPNGAWMRPFEAQLTTTGAAETVTSIEASNADFFVIDVKLPAEVNPTKPLKFTIDNNDAPAGPYSSELVVWTNTRAYIFNVTATAYDPIEADVVETAPTATASFTATFGADIYDNYQLPGEEPDGKDVVYKLEIEDDVLFTANVVGANGKTALYNSDFNGKPGPGANNSISGAGDGAAAAPYEAQIGELDGAGTGTTTYSPFYTLYNYSIAENLFHADELEEVGMTTAPMASISWYCSSGPATQQKNIKVWLANVTDEELTSTSHTTAGMTLVYEGNVEPQEGWNEFEFNQGSFAWDGSSNLLVCVQRNNGSWNSSDYWKYATTEFVSMTHAHTDGSAYDMETTTYNMSTTKLRPIVLFKSEGSKGRTTASLSEGMTLTPGVYYLAASSTSDEFTLNVNMETIPVPEPATYIYPANGEVNVTMPLTFSWELGQYTTQYRIICGTTVPPTDVLVDWTSNLAETLTVNNFYNNTTYWWRIDERNSSGEVIGPVWGFTTHFNIPQNLTATSEKLYPGETLHLSWDAVADRSYRGYNVFQDDVQINTELVTTTTYDVTGLTYNMEGYKFNVNAHYDEGDSFLSEDLIVTVTGNGSVSGKVTELDGTTGIAGAQVYFEGVDEFNAPANYTFTTGANGTFSGNLLAGDYTAMAVKEGYTPMEYDGNIHVTYNANTPNINFSLQEVLYPLGEVIAEEIDENQVKVYWSMSVMSELIENFETGDLSSFDWQNDATYPWTVVSGGADAESQYCIKSGNAGNASTTSAIQVSVEISRDGLMSFYHKISSEASYDKGYFYIDGVEKMNTSGAGSWQQKEYAITAGVHTFKWAYTKDSSVNSNEDCWYVDNISFIHDAAPAEAGWIGYDNEVNDDAIGLTSGGSFYWGISFPAATMAQYSGYTLTKVKMYDYGAHTGKTMIYKGGESAPGTLVTEQNYTCTGSNNYVEITLSSPVTVDPSQSLWVIFNNFDGQYVAPACANSGDPNGRWVSMDGVEWLDIVDAGLDCSWQIQAYLTDNAKGVTLDRKAVASNAPLASPSVVSYGNVKDLQSDPSWTASGNRAFKNYNLYRTVCSDETGESAEFLGSLNDTLYLDNDWATLEPGVYKWGVSRYYEGNRNRGRVTYNFDDGTLQGWTNIDADGDGNVWENWNSSGTVAHSGTGVAASESYINYVGALTPNNWLVSPQLELGGTMTFWAAGQDPSYASEHFGVFVSTTSNTSTSAFTQVMNETVATGTMTQYTVDLSAYAGQTGYVAIRHYNCTDMFRLNIDDITIGAGGDDPTPPTPPTPQIPNGNGLLTYTDVYGESGVRWSNCLEHRMYVNASITVTTNSGDDVTGAAVTLTNTSEPEMNLVYNITLDETGVYTWDQIRRGTYQVAITLNGFEPLEAEAVITDGTALNYTLIETIEPISDLYVSGTGWAIFGSVSGGDDPQPPTGAVTVKLTHGDNWGDGSGYQMLLDADATAFGNEIPTSGALTSSCSGTAGLYDAFEYKIPENADPNCSTSNMVVNNTVAITIPAGTYDWMITNPTPGDRIWIASSQGNVGGRQDDYVFEAGKTYEFVLSMQGSNDATNVTITDGNKATYANTFAPLACGEAKDLADVVTVDNGYVVLPGNTRVVDHYNVKLDGVMQGTTTLPFFQHDVTNLVEGETYTTSVQKVYTTGESEWVDFDWVYTSCENFEGLQSAEAAWEGDDVVLNWVLPAGSDTPDDPDDPDDPTPATVWNFDDGTLQGWTNIDADGDGNVWEVWDSDGTVAHSGTGVAASESYINYVGALTPNNWLVSPLLNLGGTLTFWAAGQDPSWASEHFGVFVSTTSNTNTSSFTQVMNETVATGTMTQYTVDLSAYAGQTGYVAIRHYNCTDMFRLNVDDIALGTSKAFRNRSTYNFDDGTLQGWTNIDADGDGNVWEVWDSDGTVAHSGTGVAASESYINYVGALTPNNWLVSPQVTLGGTMTFWAAGQDPSWASEHFGVFVSTTSNTNTSSFTQVMNETVATGTMTQYTVDLSAYAGQTGYVAIRHYNCTDMFRLNVDDITIGGEGPDDPDDPDDPNPPTPAANVIGVEIFRDGEWIAEVKAPATTYTDVAPGEVEAYQIRVVYDGDVEDYSYYTMSCPEEVIPVMFVCTAPENLTGEDQWWTYDYYGASISWTYPGEIDADWYFYDNETYATSVGLGGGQFQWAVMYPAGSFVGNTVTKVSAFDSNAMEGTVSIYTGATPTTELATKDVTFTGSGEWVEVVFDEPVTVEAGDNIWVVYDNVSGANYPASACAGGNDPNGRWVSIQGGWYDLADAGLPGYSWMIHTYITDGMSFSVYRDGELIATVPYAEGTMTYFDLAPVGNHQYQVTAISAECESDFALTPDESQNYVEIDVTNVTEGNSNTKLYPNPTTGYVKIEASGMTHITVTNALGQIVYDSDICGDMYELNMGQYNAGLYMVRIASESGVNVQRVTLVK